jgi:hypothetical protein
MKGKINKMKMITVIIAGLFFIIGCDDNPVSSENDYTTYVSTINVKSDSVDHFLFATNQGDSTATEWDIVFQAIFWSPAPPYAPEIWDPFFTSQYGVARMVASDISIVSSIPNEENFSSDFSTFEDAWYETDDNHIVQPLDYVYVVNTPDGKYPVFEVIDYYDDEGESGVFTINWKYLSE